MKRKIVKFFEEVAKLSENEQKTIGQLSYFQYKVITYLRKNKRASVPFLIQMDKSASRAQKYRYILALQKSKLCKLDKDGLMVLR